MGIWYIDIWYVGMLDFGSGFWYTVFFCCGFCSYFGIHFGRVVYFEELGLLAKIAVYERYGNSDTTIESASKNAAIWWY